MTFSWNVHTFATMASTQDRLKAMAIEDNAPEGTVVQALQQSCGRGRLGRHWDSLIGNLYMSVLLRPEECPAEKAGQISFVTAVAVSEAIDTAIPGAYDKKLKWPNDILINDKKCAGILLESDLRDDGAVDFLLLGIGVNILAPPEYALGLKEIAGDHHLAIHPFRDVVLQKLKENYLDWQKNGFAPIREKWIASAYRLGEDIKVKLAKEERAGVFKDLDASGCLILAGADGVEHRISSGEVCF
jgi:BirA family biotin operon repressor/biotin-[acetyl-CoA-carboxylase] ligase